MANQFQNSVIGLSKVGSTAEVAVLDLWQIPVTSYLLQKQYRINCHISTTERVDPGTTFYWTLDGDGISEADFIEAKLSGEVSIGTNREFQIKTSLQPDKTTEGNEELTINLFSDNQFNNNYQQTITIQDTSQSPSCMRSRDDSMNEGDIYWLTSQHHILNQALRCIGACKVEGRWIWLFKSTLGEFSGQCRWTRKYSSRSKADALKRDESFGVGYLTMPTIWIKWLIQQHFDFDTSKKPIHLSLPLFLLMKEIKLVLRLEQHILQRVQSFLEVIGSIDESDIETNVGITKLIVRNTAVVLIS